MEYAVLILIMATVVVAKDFTEYLDNQQLYEYLRNVDSNYSNMTHLYTIGTSGMGEELWVLMLSLAPPNEIAVPNVKVVGNIHGNEPVGREIIIYFIETLIEGYFAQDEEILHLLKTTRMHFLPTANPDGFSKAIEGECGLGPGRKNANNVDLNRDFKPAFIKSDEDLYRHRERETTAIEQWMSEIQFVLSVSIHSGANVVVYPYDEADNADTAHEGSETADSDVFKYLALRYATNTKGAIYEICPEAQHFNFKNGITNGAAWYHARGTMGDYNYQYHGCLELTVEASCCKYPHPSKLSDIVESHSRALMEIIKEAHQGVKGVVTCGGIRSVSYIEVLDRSVTIKTTEFGEYWKILLPGKYYLEVKSKTCRDVIVPLEIPKRKPGTEPESVILNIALQKEIVNDEIDLETMANDEDTMNVTAEDTFYQQLSETTEDRNVNTSHLLPRMESSISLSTVNSINVYYVIGSVMAWLLNWS